MKSTISAPKRETKPIVFPCLMQHRTFGIVVLFTTPYWGTVVNVPDEYTMHKLGDWSSGWANATYDHWEHFVGSITLEN